MREATSNGTADFVAVRPRKASPRRPATNRKAKAGRLRLLIGKARPRAGALLVWSAFAIIMGCIVLNATAFQKGHHPAPLFGPAAPARASAGLPPPRSVVDNAASTVAEPVGADPAHQAVASTAPDTQPGPVVARSDGIGQILRGQGKVTPAHTDQTASTETGQLRGAARVRPGQRRSADRTGGLPQARTGDRDRLTAMIGAASRPHGAPPPAN